MDIFIGLIIPIIFFGSCLALAIIFLKILKKNANPIEIGIGTVYIFSLVLFVVGMVTHSFPFYMAIDPIDMECYSPFSDEKMLTLVFYFLAFNSSVLLIWIKNTILPPLTLTLSLIFIVIGIIISVLILFQVSVHNTDTLNLYNSDHGQTLFLFAPSLSILIGAYLVYQATLQKINDTLQIKYSNEYLNFLNTFLATKCRNPLWIVILMFPVFFIATLILLLFGQDANSLMKVFTDTATWKLSQQVHPPILDHNGHYLCTVAVSGLPRIVKPIRIGQRNGRKIIVNRQLLISNAFEEMIQDISPKFHKIIRTNYDKYGYNLSKKINTTFLSSATYILMKPIEWIFLICLYLFCINPEQKINKQYAA